MFDIVIKNGHVLDTKRNLNAVMDIGINGRRISAIGNLQDCPSTQVIDASGCYVTPGIIDFHAHVFYRTSDFGMPADIALLPHGVTTVVDAGSSGASDFESFYCNYVQQSILTMKSFLHIASIGQLTQAYPENPDPKLYDLGRIKAVCEKYKDTIIGIKLRQSKNIVKELGLSCLQETIKIADAVGLRISVHASDSPGQVQETLDMLRPGDIFCHVFHQMGNTILDENGSILPEVWKARERGVLFEIAHGSMQFSGKIAKAAFQQGFLPDIVSSDLSLLSMYREPTYSFTYIMTELLNLGMPFQDIIKRCTEIPDNLLHMPSDGFIKESGIADLAVFRIHNRQMEFKDRYQNTFTGNQIIKPELTLKNGIIVHRAYDFLS